MKLGCAECGQKAKVDYSGSPAPPGWDPVEPGGEMTAGKKGAEQQARPEGEVPSI